MNRDGARWPQGLAPPDHEIADLTGLERVVEQLGTRP